MAANGNGYFIHVQIGGQVAGSGDSDVISHQVGRDKITRTAYIGEDSRLYLSGATLFVQNSGKCGSQQRSREKKIN